MLNIYKELDKLPSTIPVGDELLELAVRQPIALAVQTIVDRTIKWTGAEIKRRPLIVRTDHVRQVVEALVAGPYRYQSGSRVVEFQLDPVFAQEFKDTIPQGMVLQIEDNASLWVSNRGLMSDVEWIRDDYHGFMGWVD